MIDVHVESVLNTDPPAVDPNCPLADAASLLRNPEMPALVVSGSEQTPTGVVTESDIVAAVAQECFEISIEDCMSSPVVTVGPMTPIGLAADQMRDAGVSVLPVTESGNYLGIVTKNDLAPYLSRQRLDISWDGDPLRID